ncbi:MAG: OmpA family protein [Bacteroidia bacterium]|nr:OmpA family protein [Bacteroidia bacterium]
MRHWLTYLLFFTLAHSAASQTAKSLKPGDKAPAFVVNRGENAIQGITMPYLNKIVLLNFWSTTSPSAREKNVHLRKIFEKYAEVDYINAEGFEIISIAVQNDQKAWQEAIQKDSLSSFTHGIALKGFTADDVCLKFGITQIPSNIIIDERGEVIMRDARFADIENYLDNKKNVHPIKKDIFGVLALSSSIEDKVRFSKVYLFNPYGDTLAYTRTNENGVFTFHDLKLNQDLVLKLDNQMDIMTSDPYALYNTKAELLLKGKTQAGGFVFNLPAKQIANLQLTDSSINTHSPYEITVTKYLEFKGNSSGLTLNDEKELQGVLSTLTKNKKSILEIAVHSDSKQGEKASKSLTDKQAQALKTYFQNNGVPQNQIRTLSFGSTQPIINCLPACSEEEHKKNKRVEFAILKN